MENRFTDKEQTAQCKAFIADCHQKAWGAACHASWLEKSLNELIARYQRLQKEDKEVEAEIKANLEGLDGHTVANRNKRNELAKRRTAIGNDMNLVGKNTQEGAGAMQRLLDSVDQNLLLAEHAKTWEWQETGDHVLTVKEEAPANKLLRLWRHQAICAAEPVILKVAKPSV